MLPIITLVTSLSSCSSRRLGRRAPRVGRRPRDTTRHAQPSRRPRPCFFVFVFVFFLSLHLSIHLSSSSLSSIHSGPAPPTNHCFACFQSNPPRFLTTTIESEAERGVVKNPTPHKPVTPKASKPASQSQNGGAGPGHPHDAQPDAWRDKNEDSPRLHPSEAAAHPAAADTVASAALISLAVAKARGDLGRP